MEWLYGITHQQYDNLWSRDHQWYEPPNYRRGGWSGVCKVTLPRPVGDITVYLKLQSSHTYRSWLTLFRKRPTALREYQNITALKHSGVPTLDVEFFAIENEKALLATRSLEGYQSLIDLDIDALSTRQRRRLIRAVARYIRRIHLLHYQHNCLYPKHIFVRAIGNDWSVRLIDLEKMRRTWRTSSAMYHDLNTLYRRSLALFNQHDRFAFMRAYLGRDWSLSIHCRLIKRLKDEATVSI